MPNIDKHPPGAFCWIELSTTDQNAAKSFYGSLFGWGGQDFPMGPNDFYTMFQLEGRNTGAAFTMRPEQRSQGVPPHWLIYIAVDNVDDAAGRMAILADPQGAVFAIFQALPHN